MEATATITSKGQVTIPKAIRDLCGFSEGDQLVFRTTDYGAAIIRVPDMAELAGVVEVPPEKRGVPWEEIRRQIRETRAQNVTR
ncbi:AbrB/MazE/SpoVT family DNA-binding domain-containing protein [Candidatus Poriferisocius sp.]|uniref:AbrB/MazE/SpoVT family DNA-binding domain-containing protein n=1 Tax=Candidatus Poriferisocius sp. TaxID=3101276 RepID=UPI003B519FC2